jgi:hypothetical protein
MIYKLDNFSKYRPNFYESISLLKDNYIVTPLTNNEAVINAVKNAQPVFVLTLVGTIIKILYIIMILLI